MPYLTLLLFCLTINLTHADVGRERVYRQALADPTRLSEAVERDTYRKPLDVLRFSNVAPASRVLEIAPGGGYYTAILSRVLGGDGELIAIDPERLFKVFEQGREGFKNYIDQDPRDNVTYSTEHLDELELPANLDQIWMVLYYHDTLWTGEDRAAMNRSFYEALRPGGVYLVVDHHAESGAPASVGQTLHRMDRAIAVDEITAAGFVLETESHVLANSDDPRNDSVFAEHRRGNTDRFMLRFRKPR